jgi:Fe-S-cluster containining protein
LRGGYLTSVALAAVAYAFGLGALSSGSVLIVGLVVTRLGIYLYFERVLAYKAFEEFRAGKVRHECIACGASCHLRVNLGKDDVERILAYAKENRMQTTVVEKSGKNYWLKRGPGNACIFLKYEGNLPRCSIYAIRPVACRLYPLIPIGRYLKVDPLCPGLSKPKGHTFKEHLSTQEIGPYVRKVLGKT